MRYRKSVYRSGRHRCRAYDIEDVAVVVAADRRVAYVDWCCNDCGATGWFDDYFADKRDCANWRYYPHPRCHLDCRPDRAVPSL